MPKALNPKSEFDYVLKADSELSDGHPYKTVFHLRGLTIDEEEQVANSLFSATMGSKEMNMRSGSHSRNILDRGLQGWTNFNDVVEVGEDPADWNVTPIHFKRTRSTNGRVPSELLDKLAPDARAELADVITKGGTLTAAEGN
jgi:hypothetical protein